MLETYQYRWLVEYYTSNEMYAAPSTLIPFFRCVPTANPSKAFSFETKEECQKWITEQGLDDYLFPVKVKL